MENSLLGPKLRAANEQLTHAQNQLDSAIEARREGKPSADAFNDASGTLKAARLSIDAISLQMTADIDELPELRDCPACGRSVRRNATLCGFCWKKL